MRRVAVFVLACSGCLIKPAAPAASDAGATDGHLASCVGTPFELNLASKIPDFHLGEYGPTEREDEREMWVFNQIEADHFMHVYVARRGATDVAYGDPQLRFFHQNIHSFDPSLTRDGLRLLYVTGSGAYETTRTSLGDEFPETLSPAVGLDSLIIGNLYMTGDGLTVYFTHIGALFAATRATLKTPFSISNTPLAQNVDAFGLSPDELEMFYNPNPNAFDYHLLRMTRTDKTQPFDTATVTPLIDIAAQPNVSFDGTRLVYGDGTSLWVATRTCR
jgi:hypothetical protein